MFVRPARCHSFVRQIPFRAVGRFSSTIAQRPDVLQCTNCSLFKFGDPTSEPTKALFRNLTWHIRDTQAGETNAQDTTDRPEAWALIGPRANVLVDSALLGRARADPPESRKWPFIGTSKPIEEAIKKVSFTTRLESNSYLSQGGEFTDYTARYYGIRKDDEDAITLREHLRKYAKREGLPSDEEEASVSTTASMLKLDHLLDIPLIALSNGQTRRARIARALLTKPEVLVLEEPFTGLDVASRKMIAELLGKLHVARAPRVVLILRQQDQIPSWVDSVVQMDSHLDQSPAYIGNVQGRILEAAGSQGQVSSRKARSKVSDSGSNVFALQCGNVKYQDRHILRDISWKVKEGDRVVLTGANGSGKSTLLSLVLGDHPASYTQDLVLFEQPRSKHSTYSLAQKIGHYSPELFASFPRRYGDAGLSIHEVIGSGFDNVFTYRKLSDEQKARIQDIVKDFDPQKQVLSEKLLHKTLFAEAEPSIQALSLILRAAVKKPDLLVLDEPFAGMSSDLVQQCRRFLDEELEDRQTLIFISHYEEEWPESIGKRMHLEDGQGTETLL